MMSENSLTCPYHQWLFEADWQTNRNGTTLGMYCIRIENIVLERLSLVRVALARIAGAVKWECS